MTDESKTNSAGSAAERGVPSDDGGRSGIRRSEAARPEYTIDELAAVAGIPSRTIRFYQAAGVLPAPRRQGRVAFYDDSHIERLKLVADLQARGLRLRAVRDLLDQTELDGRAVQRWLGLEDQLEGYAQDEPVLLDGQQLARIAGKQPSSVYSRLLRLKLIERAREGNGDRFRVSSPRLLRIALQLEAAGIKLEESAQLFAILQRRLSRAAEEVVSHAAAHAGHGLGRRADARKLKADLDALFGEDSCMEAVRVIFEREVDRAVGELLNRELSAKGSRRHGGGGR